MPRGIAIDAVCKMYMQFAQIIRFSGKVFDIQDNSNTKDNIGRATSIVKFYTRMHIVHEIKTYLASGVENHKVQE